MTANPPSVVRKRLDDDCLLDGQLHPSIRQRLERVRELPLTGVANLIGVEKNNAGVAELVWQFVTGTSGCCARRLRPRALFTWSCTKSIQISSDESTPVALPALDQGAKMLLSDPTTKKAASAKAETRRQEIFDICPSFSD